MKEEHLKEIEKLQAQIDTLREAVKNENNYPIYCKSKYNSLVVKFTSLKTGEVVVNNENHKVGKVLDVWVEHTQSDNWQQLEVCPETGFFHGQAVWCWGKLDTHQRILKFFDAKNNCTFAHEGSRGGNSYTNYEPYQGDYLPWMLEAFNTLKR